MEKPYAFTVHRVRRARRHRWRWAQVTFWCPEEQLCHLWLQSLRELLEKLTSRPKHLLVFINPFGGKGQGKRIYERKVAPLFTLASITTEIIVTEHANHAKESLYELNIDKYDGIVCVGGDGMFSEVLHGLLGRTQRDAGVDQDQPRAALVPSPLRIGVIPAGSTDCVCYSTVGTSDAETSALHIVVGDSLSMDVSSVHHNGTLLRYSVSLLGYGFYGDIIKDSEKKRWMGLVRYDFSGLKTFLSHHCYEGTVSFLPAQHTVGSPRDRKPCRAGCFVCRQSKKQLEEAQKRSLYGLEGAGNVAGLARPCWGLQSGASGLAPPPTSLQGHLLPPQLQAEGGGRVEGHLRAVPGHQRHQHVLCLSPEPPGALPGCPPGRRVFRPHPHPEVLPVQLPEVSCQAHQPGRPV
eukprot:XP_028346528.1 ceramide kinase isoform X3 [Physeter catodon]